MGKKFAEWAARLLGEEIVRVWVWPIIMPMISIILSLIEKLPFTFIFWGALGTLAFTCVLLCRLDEWRYRNKVEDKLVFSDVIFNRKLENNLAFYLGIRLNSLAIFPIQFKVASIKTNFGNIIPEEEEFKKRVFDIPANGFGWFNDHPIQLADQPKSKNVRGGIEATLKYGRPDNLKYELNFKKDVTVWFDQNGNFQRCSWNDA